MNDEIKKVELFLSGLKTFNEENFFDAHEIWEELWSEYYLKDRDFIQGLIQLAVCFVHLQNENINGARSLLKKSTSLYLLQLIINCFFDYTLFQ